MDTDQGLENQTIAKFMEDRLIKHAMEATHHYIDATGTKRFACLQDRITAEQNDPRDFGWVVAQNREEDIQIQEILTGTYALHFEITIYNAERSNLQAVVKAMTQAMLNGPSTVQPGIWNMTTIKTFLYAMNFARGQERGIYAQVVYPEITVTKKQHAVCYKMLKNKLPDLREIQEVIRINGEMNAFDKMVKPIDERRSEPVTVPMTKHCMEGADPAGAHLKPLFGVNISASSVSKMGDNDTTEWWVQNGTKRRDRMSESGIEIAWNPPETGPKGKTKSGSDRSGSTSTTTPDPTSQSQTTA